MRCAASRAAADGVDAADDGAEQPAEAPRASAVSSAVPSAASMAGGDSSCIPTPGDVSTTSADMDGGRNIATRRGTVLEKHTNNMQGESNAQQQQQGESREKERGEKDREGCKLQCVRYGECHVGSDKLCNRNDERQHRILHTAFHTVPVHTGL